MLMCTTQVDEGIAIIEEHFGTLFALPASAEKGYLDVTVTVNTAGGHSSTPPDHTASKCYDSWTNWIFLTSLSWVPCRDYQDHRG